jgi:hypothetical protein
MRNATLRKLLLWVPAIVFIAGLAFVWWLSGYIL